MQRATSASEIIIRRFPGNLLDSLKNIVSRMKESAAMRERGPMII
jgi:hypothetical protein